MDSLTRRSLLAVLVAALALVAAPRAEALTIYPASGSTLTLPYGKWHRESLMPLPPSHVGVAQGVACPAYSQPVSCADDAARRIYFWTGNTDGLRLTYMHEVGHFADFDVLTDADRARYMTRRGLSGPWEARHLPHDDRPQERFAQDYGLCSIPKYRDAARLVGAPCGLIADLIGPSSLRGKRAKVRR